MARAVWLVAMILLALRFMSISCRSLMVRRLLLSAAERSLLGQLQCPYSRPVVGVSKTVR
jgi:hypothetical protein